MILLKSLNLLVNYEAVGALLQIDGCRIFSNPLYFQAKCYLAAINSLHVVNPKKAWIVKPLDRVNTTVSLSVAKHLHVESVSVLFFWGERVRRGLEQEEGLRCNFIIIHEGDSQ